ncbi:MAG TPA: DNA cytosine methyltransferase [Verrucomicrobiae bacterium]|nr:DNA cytosine methyltransferase [Verrucomicrobiae bacterium]
MNTRRKDKSTKSPTRPPLAIDLFSGCGGLTLGLRQAGFEVLGAIEHDPAAVRTYKANHPRVLVKQKDITGVSARAFRRELKLRRGQLDLLAGCPPCQGFSSLRTRNGARKIRDRRNNLVQQMLRFARAFQPKAIMMENVPGLVRHKPFKELCEGLRRLGYKIIFDVKDAAHYGVPQRRKRLILLAGRGFDFSFAKGTKRIRSVRGAIGNLSEPGRSRDPLHNLPEKKRATRIMRMIKDIPKDGGSRGDLPMSRQLDCHRRTSGFTDIYGRMAWDSVAPTMTSGCFNPSKGRFLHPERDRAITMREAALLQSFPSTYRFDLSCGKEEIALMIGNALPPEFVRRHALQVVESLKTRRSTI